MLHKPLVSSSSPYATVSYYSASACNAMTKVETYVLDVCLPSNGLYMSTRRNGDTALEQFTCTDSSCIICQTAITDYSLECSTTMGVLTFPQSLYITFDSPGIYYFNVDSDASGSCAEQYIMSTTWEVDIVDCGIRDCCQVTPNAPTAFPTSMPSQPTSQPSSFPTYPTSQPTASPTAVAMMLQLYDKKKKK